MPSECCLTRDVTAGWFAIDAIVAVTAEAGSVAGF